MAVQMVNIRYRAWQFWKAVRARPAVQDLKQAAGLLGPSLLDLFYRMSPGDQAHSLRIFRQLLDQGERNLDLLIAALLHDVGKSLYPLATWERVWIVIGRALFPARLEAWGCGEPRGWRRSFVIACQHPQWGAELAAQAGASVLIVWLIRHHQERSDTDPTNLEGQLLKRLQQFDDHN